MRPSLLGSLRETSRLDIRAVNYLWGTKGEVYRKLYPRQGIAKGLVLYLYRWARSVKIALAQPPPGEVPKRPILFFADSINQLRAMEPVKKRIPEAAFWTDRGLSGELAFPGWLARTTGLLFIPLLAYRALRDPVVRNTLAYGLADYLDSYGFFLAGLRSLPRLNPRALALSNDHSAQTRALLFAARRLAIPTIYLQHAPVTEDFPPLEFDLALLDGMEAFRKYRVGRSGCRVYLVGNPRRPASGRKTTAGKAVGLAFSDLDPSPIVEKLVEEAARELLGAQLVVRPHPGDQRQEWFRGLAERSGADFSDPRVQNVWDFLGGLSFLIAGNSGIFLDAALVSVVPLQHEALAGGYDHYGFTRSGFLRVIRSSAEVRELLPRLTALRQDLISKLKDFDATFDTELEGRAAELAAAVVKDRVLGEASPFTEERIESGSSACFRLRQGG